MQSTPVPPASETQDVGLIRESVVAGLAGAAAVAAWFVLANLLAGKPLLLAPAMLGTLLFHGVDGLADGPQFSLLTIGGYSVVHLGLFAVAGLVFASVFRRVDRWPPLGLIVVLAFGVLEIAAALVAVRFAPEAVAGTGLVVIGVANLVGPAAMMGVLWQRHPLVRWRFTVTLEHLEERENQPIKTGWFWRQEGLQAGLIAGLFVAAWYGFMNYFAGRSLYETPAVLGTIAFRGPGTFLAEGASHDTNILLAYTFLHLVVFGLMGFLAAAAFHWVERLPPVGALLILGVVIGEAFFYTLVIAAGPRFLGPIDTVAVGVANVLAAGIIIAFLWVRLPQFRQKMLEGHFDHGTSDLPPTPAQ